MRTKIYVTYGKQSRLNQLKDYIEVKINRLNYKTRNFVKVAQRKWKGNTYMGLLTESGLMKVAEFEKVSFDQFIRDWWKHILKHPEEPMYEKSIYGDLKLPYRKTVDSAGHDFISPADITIRPGDARVIPTGIRCKIEKGWVLLVFIRSSLGIKAQARIGNGTGVIDGDYYHADNEGHIFIKVENHGNEPLKLKKGDAFAQGVFLPYGVADEETVTTKRTGGIGSTGK